VTCYRAERSATVLRPSLAAQTRTFDFFQKFAKKPNSTYNVTISCEGDRISTASSFRHQIWKNPKLEATKIGLFQFPFWIRGNRPQVAPPVAPGARCPTRPISVGRFYRRFIVNNKPAIKTHGWKPHKPHF
jgi:hypothetical protein